jgi:hypothetical protein
MTGSTGAERKIRDTAAATSLPCAGITSEAPPTTSNDQDVLRRSLAGTGKARPESQVVPTPSRVVKHGMEVW